MSSSETLTLAEFLLDRIRDDERAIANGGDCRCGDGEDQRPDCPGRIASECEAKRRIVEIHGAEAYGDAPDESCCIECGPLRRLGRSLPWPCPTLRALALPYADHPDYRPAWRADA